MPAVGSHWVRSPGTNGVRQSPHDQPLLEITTPTQTFWVPQSRNAGRSRSLGLGASHVGCLGPATDSLCCQLTTRHQGFAFGNAKEQVHGDLVKALYLLMVV